MSMKYFLIVSDTLMSCEKRTREVRIFFKVHPRVEKLEFNGKNPKINKQPNQDGGVVFNCIIFWTVKMLKNRP